MFGIMPGIFMIVKAKYLLRVLFLLLMLSKHTTFSKKTKVITTNTGKVQGVVEPSSISGMSVQKFTNIPYAEAPVGRLRFAKPEPKKPWNGTLQSTNDSIICWQTKFFDLSGKMTEDCLILNIWTPYPQKNNQSVMIWIHGGGFKWGDSIEFYGGNNFVAVGDVILVTINYRLSELGFLTTGDERIKGNFGLFDQRLAMKWVKENIASFGGDPQSITIFGVSAGAACVSAHTLSSGSWPYFDRAILQSGGMDMPWTIATKEKINHTLDVLLDIVGCSNDDKLLDCLQNITEKDLENAYIANAKRLNGVSSPPTIDGDFIIDSPKTLVDQGSFKDADVIIGVTKDEQFLQLGYLLETAKSIDELSKKLEEHVNTYLQNPPQDIFDEAIKLYRPNKNFQSKREALQAIIDLGSDVVFICGAREETIKHSQFLQSSVYLYRYSHASEVPTPELFYFNGTFGFASHGLDIVSVFGWPINNPKYPSEDRILSIRMMLYWTNFAKNGDPNIGTTKLPIVIDGIDNLPEWPKFTNSTREYLDMESESRMVIRSRLREKYCEFLKDPESFVRRKGTSASTPTTRVANKHKSFTMLLLFIMPLLELNF